MSAEHLAGSRERPRWLGFVAAGLLIVVLIAGFFGLWHGLELWLQQRLPARLLRPGPWGAALWRWLVLPLVAAGAWTLGLVLSSSTRRLFSLVAQRTSTRFDDAILLRIGAPVTFAWLLLMTYLLPSWLELSGAAQASVERILRTLLLLCFFWALARTIGVIGQAVMELPWAKGHPSSRALLPLATRVSVVAIWALGVVAMLSALGYPVASIVAGLGIGGLAVALAAQKTIENLFGAFSIGADQPFREGDFVRIEDFVGTVELIGLRSTRIRTLDRTLVTIPNGKLAEMRLESYSARDRMRFACIVGLVYSTTPAQLRTILQELERVLRNHPKIWPDAVVVRFKELGESALNIEVMAWFQTAESAEFQLIRQDVLLQFMEVVDRAGSSFAFPTTTVNLVSEQTSSASHPAQRAVSPTAAVVGMAAQIPETSGRESPAGLRPLRSRALRSSGGRRRPGRGSPS